jgi:probable F420-dependent oxidoreductase
MKFSLALPIDHVQHGAEFVGPDAIRELSRGAEDAGFDAINVTDHPCPTANWINHGGHHAQDPFVLLAMVAAHTSRLRLQTYLLVLPYRNPFLSARAIASLDAFSGGRVIVSAGVGYLKGEFKTLGVDFERRGEIFEESIAAMKAAWSDKEFSFEGEFFRAGGNSIQPQPVQKPYPPIWIGGNSKASIRRAVDMGDGWSPMFGGGAGLAQTARTAEIATLEDLAERLQILRDYIAERGRTRPLDLCVSSPVSTQDPSASAGQIVDGVGRLADMGVNWCTVSAGGATRAEWLRNVERLAKDVVQPLKAKA